MAEPQQATGHDNTHTDMLLSGVHGEAAEEEASMLQSSLPHQPDPSILHQTISHPTDPSLLQQPLPHTETALLQGSLSHSQTAEESLMQSEELTGIQLISSECDTVLQCDLHPQTSLSVDSLGHTATLQYSDTNTVSNSQPQYDIAGSANNVSQSSGLQNDCQMSETSLSQNIQPTFITTSVPISSLLRPPYPSQQNSGETSTDAKLSYAQPIQPQPVIKQTSQNVIQQAIALNIPTNIVAALANLPFLQTNPTQNSVPAVTKPQNVISMSPAPVSLYQNIPASLIRHLQTSTASSNSTTVSVPSTLQRILPDTQKPNTSTTDINNQHSVQGIPFTAAVLSGTAVFCASGSQLHQQIDSSILPPILTSVNTSVVTTIPVQSQSHMQSQPILAPAVTMATPIGQSHSVEAQAVGMPVASAPPVEPTVSSAQTGSTAEQCQVQTYLSQFPMPLPVMSTQETPSVGVSDVQSLQACLSHPQLQSLGQIIFNPPRSQGAVSPSFPQLDPQQITQLNLLRQSGYNISESDSAGIQNMSTSMTSTSAGPQNSAETYPASSLSPMLSGHFQVPGILPTVALSPSEPHSHNIATRLYMTSPVTAVPLGQDNPTQEKTDVQTGVESASPAFTLANMSVIDMLLKHPTDLPDEDRAALPHKDTAPQPFQTKTPKLTGIYCVDCNNSYKDGCQYHKADNMYIPDNPILPRAKLTLPSCFIFQTSGVKITSETVNNLGVFANMRLSRKTEFGPLIGKVVSEETYTYTSSFTWKIFYNGHHNVIDTSDENECNWMIYVKPASNLQDQNIVVYQRGEELYFVTNKDVEAGTEMLFWFAKDYAKLLGLPVKPSQLWPTNCPFCQECNKVFNSWKALGQHVKDEHPNSSTRKWPCQMCNRRFTTSTKLKTHMVALHMRLKPFSCTQCGKKFSDQSNLRQHLHIHTGERRFKCSLCPNQFRQKAHLQSHMIIHTGTEKLQCRFCPSKLLRPSDLKAHELKHTKEKCYPCALCVKVFYKLSNYKKHMLVHNKERNFLCQDCDKAFYSKYHLQRHRKTCKGVKLADRGLEGGDENLYSTLERDPQVEIDMMNEEDNMIGNTTTSICARLRVQRQER